MPKPTPRQTLEALERQVDAIRGLEPLLPPAQRIVSSRALTIADVFLEMLEHQVERWEQTDELAGAFLTGAAIAMQGGDPSEVLRDVMQRYGRPVN